MFGLVSISSAVADSDNGASGPWFFIRERHRTSLSGYRFLKLWQVCRVDDTPLDYSPYSLKWCIIFSVFNNRRAQFLKNIILCESSFYASFQQSGLGQLQYKSPGAEICLCSVPKLTNLPSFEKVKIQNFSFSNFTRSAGFVPKARFLPLLKQGNRNTTPHSPNIRILSGLERNSKPTFFWNFAEKWS